MMITSASFSTSSPAQHPVAVALPLAELGTCQDDVTVVYQ